MGVVVGVGVGVAPPTDRGQVRCHPCLKQRRLSKLCEKNSAQYCHILKILQQPTGMFLYMPAGNVQPTLSMTNHDYVQSALGP